MGGYVHLLVSAVESKRSHVKEGGEYPTVVRLDGLPLKCEQPMSWMYLMCSLYLGDPANLPRIALGPGKANMVKAPEGV